MVVVVVVVVLFTPNPSSRTHICSTSPSLSTFCMHFHTVGSVVDASTGDPLGRKNGESSTFSKNSRSSVYRIASGRLSSSSLSSSKSSVVVAKKVVLCFTALLLDAKRFRPLRLDVVVFKRPPGQILKAVVVFIVVVVISIPFVVCALLSWWT